MSLRILPSHFWQPVQFENSTFLMHPFNHLIDRIFINPFSNQTRPLRWNSRIQQYVSAQNIPEFHLRQFVIRTSLLALLFFAKPKAALTLTAGLFCTKVLYRSYLNSKTLMLPEINRSSSQVTSAPQREVQRTGPLDEVEKRNIIRWVQKHLCSHFFYFLALGITDKPFGLGPSSSGEEQQVRVFIGQEEASFPLSFLHSIPFFSAMMRCKMREHEDSEEGLTLSLSTQSPFSLQTLQQLHAYEQGKKTEILNEGLDPMSLDFLGLHLTIEAMKNFETFQEFQKSIQELNGSLEVPRLPNVDLQSLRSYAPQVKVGSHNPSSISIDNPELEMRIKQFEETLGHIPPVLELSQVQEHLDSIFRTLIQHFDLLSQSSCSQPELYLCVNRLVDAYIHYLYQIDQRHRDQGFLTQEFLKLLNHKQNTLLPYLTVLNLPLSFDHTRFSEVTAKLPNLYWLTFSFFDKQPENLLEWIRTWNSHCSKLQILALTGLDRHGAAWREVMNEMPNLEFFELD